MATTGPRFDATPSVSNHFAWMRTHLALQRTLMAAVRTSVSLIGFGFTVAQFFAKMRDKLPEEMHAIPLNVPRDLGLLLIAAGVGSLVLFTLQYHIAVSYLRTGDFAALAPEGDRTLRRPTYMVAYVVMVIGVAAFASILLRF